MRKAEGLRSSELTAALARAVAGNTADLFRQLELQSGLPGPRMNMNLGVAFAQECVALGAKADDLAYRMAALPADEARGASGKEFVSVCGVLAIGARAASAKDAKLTDRALEMLEEKADDVRFRVRDAVPLALASLGSSMRGELADRLDGWMDRYFHAAAVILALAEPSWLETFPHDAADVPIRFLRAAFELAHDAPRSAFRYPGHKALVEALTSTPKAVARRFGPQMFDQYRAWAETVKIPELRDAIVANLADTQMKKAFGDQMKQVKDLVEQSKGPPRDPTIIRQGTRGRGKKRDRR
jgi:hypothetical protein